MKVISFFSGAGGLDLGFKLAGHEVVWANDFDKYAVESYNKNIGEFSSTKAILGDITELLSGDSEDISKILPDADVVIGGFPCQGFSIANVDRSMEDERNYLYLELLKAISIKQPKYFLLENVKGLENMNSGKVLRLILDDLEDAGTSNSKVFSGKGPGYTVVYNVFNALDFGVPQNRERVIILGIRNDLIGSNLYNTNIVRDKLTSSRKALFIRTTHSKNSKKIELISPHDKINKLYSNWKNGIYSHLEILSDEKYSYRNIKDAIYDLPLEYSDEFCGHYNHIGSKCKVKISNRVGNRETYWTKHAPTIMGRGSGTGGPLIPPHPEKHRRFSVREVARFQTFPDEFIFCGSNSAAYRQIGNAVPVLMAYHIASIFNIK
ncbi:MAG: DNA cytosine methyltransferase [Tissierellales bacterium]|jgi:DNA (cytosine-5)-methyltransferase 1|nr:DNA cytosine methyltransferase [Tissierellales bacterium]